MANLLGKRIKEFRERLGMSQEDACRDICSQAYISKIENGDVYPSAAVLLKLSDRFSIEISYLLDVANTPRHDYIIEFFTQIREAAYNRDYTTIESLIKTERNNKLFKDIKYQQFFLWHEGICQFQKHSNPINALRCFDKALSLTSAYKKTLSEREIEILISKGNILTDCDHMDDAFSTYNKALFYLEKLPNITNVFVPIRLYYNFGRHLRFRKKYEDSIQICKKGIKIGEKNNLLYLKGDLYFQKAYSYQLQGNYSKAHQSYRRAKLVYELEENKESLDMVKRKIESLAN